MARRYFTSFISKSSSSSISSSAGESDDLKRTQSTNVTAYSEPHEIIKHYYTETVPVEELPRGADNFYDAVNPNESTGTYVSSSDSEEEVVINEIEQIQPKRRRNCFVSDAIPSNPPDFAELFPSTRRLLVQHDDSTPDGNLNLRVDTEVTTSLGTKTKMTLFHLRMRDLQERQFSLRRYCRESGREVCSAKRKYIRPCRKMSSASSTRRPSSQHSWSTALQTFRSKGHRRHDSGYVSDDDSGDDCIEEIAARINVKPTVPTNIIKLEFSNYSQVEIRRRRKDHEKMYDFEYWGEFYTWQRKFSQEDDESIYSYELINLKNNKCIAYIMPDKLSSRQSKREEAEGGWIPPSTMRFIDKGVSADVGDVIVATGLIALTDDCIKRRWPHIRSPRI